MINESVFGMGANPPPEFEWQIGKTAGSISFVNRAQVAIAELQAEVDRVKNGKSVITVKLEPSQFLKSKNL